mmetsp:Transcript_12355/g.14180  ORF Transcript_12355/g.14180 Transcript_12355/m.14180 type:complete len:227 (+) Transcript_12355:1443-2123(+)
MDAGMYSNASHRVKIRSFLTDKFSGRALSLLHWLRSILNACKPSGNDTSSVHLLAFILSAFIFSGKYFRLVQPLMIKLLTWSFFGIFFSFSQPLRLSWLTNNSSGSSVNEEQELKFKLYKFIDKGRIVRFEHPMQLMELTEIDESARRTTLGNSVNFVQFTNSKSSSTFRSFGKRDKFSQFFSISILNSNPLGILSSFVQPFRFPLNLSAISNGNDFKLEQSRTHI